MSNTSITFQTSSPVSQQNSTREKSAAREQRIALLLKGSTFLGVLGVKNAEILTVGKSLALPVSGKVVSIKDEQTEALKCAACGGVNGLRDSNPSLLAMTSFWVAADGKTLLAFSDSCRVRYAEPTIGSWAKGQEVYRTVYPKAPVKA